MSLKNLDKETRPSKIGVIQHPIYICTALVSSPHWLKSYRYSVLVLLGNVQVAGGESPDLAIARCT